MLFLLNAYIESLKLLYSVMAQTANAVINSLDSILSGEWN